jgi:hypothetical protein
MATIKITGEKGKSRRYPVIVKSESTGEIGTGSVNEDALARRYGSIREALRQGESIVGMQATGFKELDIWDLQFESPLSFRERLVEKVQERDLNDPDTAAYKGEFGSW